MLRSSSDIIARNWRRIGVVGLCCVIPLLAAAAPREPQPGFRSWDGQPGFSRLSDTASPDGRYCLVWAPDGISAEQMADLPEWPADVEISGDDIEAGNYLYDNEAKRITMRLPGFHYFAGHGWRRNRGELYVAWTADSRGALAISAERWDDEGLVWIDPVKRRVTDLKGVVEKACLRVLQERENDKGADMQFSNPSILPGNILVLDGSAGHMKEGPCYDYRLTFRMVFPKGKPRLELLNAEKLLDDSREVSGG